MTVSFVDERRKRISKNNKRTFLFLLFSPSRSKFGIKIGERNINAWNPKMEIIVPMRSMTMMNNKMNQLNTIPINRINRIHRIQWIKMAMMNILGMLIINIFNFFRNHPRHVHRSPIDIIYILPLQLLQPQWTMDLRMNIDNDKEFSSSSSSIEMQPKWHSKQTIKPGRISIYSYIPWHCRLLCLSFSLWHIHIHISSFVFLFSLCNIEVFFFVRFRLFEKEKPHSITRLYAQAKTKEKWNPRVNKKYWR